MRIRLHGTPEQCQKWVEALGTVGRVASQSPPYPNEREPWTVRVYLRAYLPDDDPLRDGEAARSGAEADSS